MTQITFFTKPDCGLCDAALFVIRRVQRSIPFDIKEVDISAEGNEVWFDAFRNDIPVVHLNGRGVFRHRVDERRLRNLLEQSSV